MFDIGFSELVVIGLVALIVIGPEDLPRVARTAGHLLGKLRRYVADVKADIGREMELADLKRMQEEVKEAASEIQNTINNHARVLQEELQQAAAPLSELTQATAESQESAHEPLSGDAEPVHVATPKSALLAETPDDQSKTVYPAQQETLSPRSDTAHIVEPSQPSGKVPSDIGTGAMLAGEQATVPPDDNQLDLFGMPIQKPSQLEDKA